MLACVGGRSGVLGASMNLGMVLDGCWGVLLGKEACGPRQALPGVAYLHRSGRFAVAAAAELYRGILDDIEVHDGDVFTRRAHVSDGEKLRRLPGVWWRATTGGYSRG